VDQDGRELRFVARDAQLAVEAGFLSRHDLSRAGIRKGDLAEGPLSRVSRNAQVGG
jgi:hypothetical protein